MHGSAPINYTLAILIEIMKLFSGHVGIYIYMYAFVQWLNLIYTYVRLAQHWMN